VIRRVFHELRLVGELARKEALDVRAIALGVLALVITTVAIVNAVWEIDPHVVERARRHFRLSLAVVATLPIVAECFGGDERTGGAGWARPLPVSATRVFLARVLVVAAFGCLASAVAGLTDLIPVHFDRADLGGRGSLISNGGEVMQMDAAQWGSSVLAIGAVAAVAIVTRHAAAAFMTGLGVIGWCVLAFDPAHTTIFESPLRMPFLWTRLVVVPLAGDGVAILGCVAAASCAYSLRGRRERSAARRGGVIAIGAVSVATVTFAMAGDPLAEDSDALYSSSGTGVSGASASHDGEAVLVHLYHHDRDPNLASIWTVDTRSGEYKRVFAPPIAGFGALKPLIDLGYARWRGEDDRLTAAFGVGGNYGTGSYPAGYLIHDRFSGVTRQLEPEAPEDVWNAKLVGRPGDGVIHERWTRDGVDWTADVHRRPAASLAEGAPRLILYVDPDWHLHHLDLTARTDVDTGLVLKSRKTKFDISPHDQRWLLIQRGDRTKYLLDRETGTRQPILAAERAVWTKRSEPLLIRAREAGDPRPTRWSLLGPDARRPIHFEHAVDEVADLDGERWFGFNQKQGTVYVFDADGHVIIDLRPGAVQ